jgi:hypothetical protein
VLILLTGGNNVVRRFDGLRWHDIHTKFHKARFRHSKAVRRDTHTGTQTAWWYNKPTFIFLNKENMLQIIIQKIQTEGCKWGRSADLYNKYCCVSELLDDAACIWDYIASNSRAIGQWCLGKDLEGRCHGLIEVLPQKLHNSDPMTPDEGSRDKLLEGFEFSPTLKMEAICSSKTSVNTKQTTRRYIPEDGTPQAHRGFTLRRIYEDDRPGQFYYLYYSWWKFQILHNSASS